MKSSKRILALIVAMIFVLTSMVSFNVFAEEGNTFTDVDAANSYYQAITSLVADGVIDGYAEADGTFTFKPDNTITRAEFSKLLAVASNPNYVFSATSTLFSDLQSAEAEGGWAIPYIAYAVGTGAINGYEDGTFRPQNPVTYAEATKMIVCTLGYGKVVDTTLTPWYQGYLDVAQQIGLTKRAGGNPDTPAVRGLVAQLIYNMVNECKVYDGVVSNDGTEIKLPSGTGGSGSTLNDSEEGVLLGVFEHCLTGEALTKQEVLIDDEIYQLGDYSADELKDMVGYAVKFNISGNRKKELTKVTKLSNDNDKTYVEDWQIADITSDEIEYYADEDDYDSDDASTLKFDSNLYVIYNGFVVDPDDIDDNFIEEYLNVNCGNLTLISNDGNVKDVELAIVESYELYHVKTVSTINGVTTFYDTNADKLGLTGGIALDEDDVVDANGEVNVTKISTKGGSAQSSTLTGIAKNSTVAVAVPFDGKEGTKVIISSASISSGTVKEIDEDRYIKIGSEKYEFSPYFDAIKKAGVELELEVGDTAKFYLDPFGKISFFEKSESTNPYGLIVTYKTGGGVDTIPELRILVSSGKTLDYPLKDKVKINGKSYDADEVIEVLKKSCPTYDENNEKYIIQLVKYVTSTQNGKTVFSELEIVDMDKPESGSIVPYPVVNSKNSKKAIFANDGVLTNDRTSGVFKHEGSSQFTMSSSTVVFVVPNDKSDINSYKKSTKSYFVDGTNYCVEPYDVETGTTAKAVICYLDKETTVSGGISAATHVCFVEDVRPAYNKDGEDVRKLKYYTHDSHEIKEVLSSNDADIISKLDSLNPGELIKIYIEGKGTEDEKIAEVRTVYVGGKLTTECGNIKDGNENHITKTGESVTDYFQAILGTVSSIDTNYKTVNVVPYLGITDENSGKWQPYTWTDSTKFFDYNEKTKEFEEKAEGDIRSYEEAGKDATQAVFIIMNKKIVAIYDLTVSTSNNNNADDQNNEQNSDQNNDQTE